MVRAAAWSAWNGRQEWFDAELQDIDKALCKLGERAALARYQHKHDR